MNTIFQQCGAFLEWNSCISQIAKKAQPSSQWHSFFWTCMPKTQKTASINFFGTPGKEFMFAIKIFWSCHALLSGLSSLVFIFLLNDPHASAGVTNPTLINIPCYQHQPGALLSKSCFGLLSLRLSKLIYTVFINFVLLPANI